MTAKITTSKATKIANNPNDKILKIIVTVFDKKVHSVKETFFVSKEDEVETLYESIVAKLREIMK